MSVLIYDNHSDGFERCNRFSNAARAGIGIGICASLFARFGAVIDPRTPVVLFLALVLAATYYRRRRNARANLAYMNQAQGHPNSHGNVYAGGAPGFAPQYPPAAYGGGYDASTGFAPVRFVFLILGSSLAHAFGSLAAWRLAAAVLPATTRPASVVVPFLCIVFS
ncbi:hypothetical protein BC834DRAFT_881203 [Gloeopeniophorella convolvens]|nr:hypothetical protein BC834DRAFT_881203 [Gloeopeniophorella convolvens]